MKSVCSSALMLAFSFSAQAITHQIEIHAHDAGMEIESFTNLNYKRLQENFTERLILGYLPEATHWIYGEDLSILAKSDPTTPLPCPLNGKSLSSIQQPEAYDSKQLSGKTIALPVGLHLQRSIACQHDRATIAIIDETLSKICINTTLSTQ